MYDSKQPLGNLNQQKIVELVDNEDYKKLRTQLLNNEQPSGCKRCYQLEESGVQTLRQTTSLTYSNLIDPIRAEQKNTISDIKYVDIRFSNICNFKCRTCGPELSHKWGAEMPALKNQPDPGVSQIPREQFWQFYERALETCEEIVFAGGEALMQEEHYAALNKLIELGKFDVKIFYTTNMSTLKYKQYDLFDVWSKFNNIEIYASLDASWERAEYLRKGTDWAKVVENRKRIMTLPNLKFSITPTISLFNVWHFPDFHREWIEEGLVDIKNVRLNILTHPPRQQANVLSNKEEIITKWEAHLAWLMERFEGKDWEREVLSNQFVSVINFLRTEPSRKAQLAETFDWVNSKVDLLREENIYTVFPELKKFIQIASTKSPTFCVFPFFNLNSNTDGSVKLCCNIRENVHVKKTDGTEFNLGHDNIEDIWSSDYMNEVRRNMLLGNEVADCKDCYKHEKLSGSSSRTESNTFWLKQKHIVRKIDSYRFDNQLEPVSSLELRPGNTCNLSCNSCWGYSSSKSNEERLQILNKPETPIYFKKQWQSEFEIPKDINHWFKTDVYKDNIQKTSKHLTRVYITGGEPTLIKENRRLLQDLLDQGNKDCFVSFTTNGTQADSELLELLRQFPNNEVQISLDGVGEQAHYVRYPTDWKQLTQNIGAIAAVPNVKIVFYTVISAYNLNSLGNILTYVDSIAAVRQVGWYPIMLDNPSYMSTHIWPRSTRGDAKVAIDNLPLSNLKKYVSQNVFQKVYDYYLADVEYTDRIKQFKEFNRIHDDHRGTNFNTTFPELVCLI